jgi:hypothetical protein
MHTIKLLILGSVMLITGCTTEGDVKSRSFELSSVLKNDIDLVSETHQTVVRRSLLELAVKLYKRNPSQWRKAGYSSLEEAVTKLEQYPFASIHNKDSIECIRLTFDESFQGDRVKTFITGLQTMIMRAYDNHETFYMHNMLEAQKLYDSARNLELAAWLLRSKRKKDGTPFLFSSGTPGEAINLSFERLFGKMINAQDMLAQIMADRTHRQIKNTIQAVLTAFIPI